MLDLNFLSSLKQQFGFVGFGDFVEIL